MTRRIRTDRAEKEARIQEALTAVHTGQYDCFQAARKFNIPPQTLSDRMKALVSATLALKQRQLLSHAEEKELVR